jgi:restriction system protein
MAENIKTKIRGVDQNDGGEISRQEVIRRCIKKDEILLLEREPLNQFDPNAISVWISPDKDPWDEGDYQVGYLSRELASRLSPIIDAGGRVTCAVLDKTGGSSGESYGVNVELGIYSVEEVAEYENKKAAKKQQNLIDNSPKGKPMAQKIYVIDRSPKNKWVTFSLCLLLGIMGAHYFYVGRFGKGLLYLCTVGLFCFGWISDIFTILGGGFKDAAGSPLR